MFRISKIAKLALITVAIAVLTFSTQAIANWQAPALSSDTMVVIVIDTEGKAVPNALVSIKINKEIRNHRTNAKGRFDTELTGIKPGQSLRIAVKVDGYLTQMAQFYQDRNLPKSVLFRMERGTTIGGRVVDQMGKPIAEANISVWSIGVLKVPERTQASVRWESRTDQDGQWRLDMAPANPEYIRIQIQSDEFARLSVSVPQLDWKRLRDRSFEQKLEPGHRVSGEVEDENGNPVAGAIAQIGRDSFSQPTDEEGKFDIKGLPSGSQMVTVLSQNHAPTQKLITLNQPATELKFELETGEPIRILVRDSDRHQIPVTWVQPAFGNDRSYLKNMNFSFLFNKVFAESQTKSGEFVWKHAPPGPLTYSIRAGGYRTLRMTFAPREEPHSVKLFKTLTVQIHAIDRETQKPITRIKVTQGHVARGRTQPRWNNSKSMEAKNGQYEIQRTQGDEDVVIRIESLGYQAIESKTLSASDPIVELDIELTRSDSRTISMVAPQGSLVKNANVFMVRNGEGSIYVRNGAVVDNAEDEPQLNVLNDSFDLPTINAGKFGIVVFADQGYAIAKAEDLQNKSEIKLKPWARIEGHAMIGDKPAAGEKIKMFPEFKNSPWSFFDYEAIVEPDGQFIIDRIPTEVVDTRIWRELILTQRNGTIHSTSANSVPVTLKPGRTIQVKIGGSGRAVTGKVLPPVGYDEPIGEWNSGTRKLDQLFPAKPKNVFGFRIEPDGSFRIDDVPDGRFQLTLNVTENDIHQLPGVEKSPIGELQMQVIVKSKDGETGPIELGELRLK